MVRTKGRFDDFAVSNNLDAERILTTIVAIVMDFTNSLPEAIIYAAESTPFKTRLYQIGINKYWLEIKKIFEVFGLIEHGGFSLSNAAGITRHLFNNEK